MLPADRSCRLAVSGLCTDGHRLRQLCASRRERRAAPAVKDLLLACAPARHYSIHCFVHPPNPIPLPPPLKSASSPVQAGKREQAHSL